MRLKDDPAPPSAAECDGSGRAPREERPRHGQYCRASGPCRDEQSSHLDRRDRCARARLRCRTRGRRCDAPDPPAPAESCRVSRNRSTRGNPRARLTGGRRAMLGYAISQVERQTGGRSARVGEGDWRVTKSPSTWTRYCRLALPLHRRGVQSRANVHPSASARPHDGAPARHTQPPTPAAHANRHKARPQRIIVLTAATS